MSVKKTLSTNTHLSFNETVERNFIRAAETTDYPKGLLDQILSLIHISEPTRPY